MNEFAELLVGMNERVKQGIAFGISIVCWTIGVVAAPFWVAYKLLKTMF